MKIRSAVSALVFVAAAGVALGDNMLDAGDGKILTDDHEKHHSR